MSGEFTREQLRAYRDREWGLLRRSKEAWWAADARAQGPIGGLKASTALWEHARTVDPQWPTAEERRQDLEHHIRLAGKLLRLTHVFPNR